MEIFTIKLAKNGDRTLKVADLTLKVADLTNSNGTCYDGRVALMSKKVHESHYEIIRLPLCQ